MVPFNFYQVVIVGIVLLLLVQCTNMNNHNYENAKTNIAFNNWLEDYKQNAKNKLNVNEELLEQIFNNVKYNQEIVRRDSRQAEFTLTQERYFQIVLPEETYQKGNQFLKKYWKQLNIISEKYKVPPYIVVAFIGIETRYGTKPSQYKAAEALATMAFNPRRTTFFTNELNAFVTLVNKGDISPEAKSSWAGALGYPQFMPSTYLYYGKDGSGNGTIDLINNHQDVFASVSNFLRALGWNYYRDWGYEVKLPENFNYNLVESKSKKPIYEWVNMGITNIDGKQFKTISALARIVITDSHKAYLVTSNFDVIMRWNKSTLFALAVGTLSDELKKYSESLQKEEKNKSKQISKATKIKSISKKSSLAQICKNNRQKENQIKSNSNTNALKPSKQKLTMDGINPPNKDWYFEEQRRVSAGEDIK